MRRAQGDRRHLLKGEQAQNSRKTGKPIVESLGKTKGQHNENYKGRSAGHSRKGDDRSGDIRDDSAARHSRDLHRKRKGRAMIKIAIDDATAKRHLITLASAFPREADKALRRYGGLIRRRLIKEVRSGAGIPRAELTRLLHGEAVPGGILGWPKMIKNDFRRSDHTVVVNWIDGSGKKRGFGKLADTWVQAGEACALPSPWPSRHPRHRNRSLGDTAAASGTCARRRPREDWRGTRCSRNAENHPQERLVRHGRNAAPNSAQSYPATGR